MKFQKLIVSIVANSSTSTGFINAVQALFGIVWSIMYGGIIEACLTTTKIPSEYINVHFAKIVFLLGSPLILALIVYNVLSFQSVAKEYRSVWSKSFPDGLRQSLDLLAQTLKWMILLWAYLGLTYFLFQEKLDPYLIGFSAWHPVVWLLFEAYLVWTSPE